MKRAMPLSWWVVWGAFSVITLWLYAPAAEAGFTSDFTAHVEMFMTRADLGWWNSYGWRGNQPVLFGAMSAWYHWFGLQPLPWFVLFGVLHALNGTLLYQLLGRLTRASGSPNAGVALAGGLLFLVHPYHGDVVIWKVCLHYLFSTASLLGMLVLLFRPGAPGTVAEWVLFHGLFAVALFSLELALIFPLILGITIWWQAREQGWDRRQMAGRLAVVILPQVALIGVWFLMNRIRLSSWVGHYGTDVHLRVAPDEILSHAINYFLKYLVFTRDWPDAVKGFLGEWHFRDPATLYAASLAGLLGLVFLIRISMGKGLRMRQGLWAVVMFFLALGPVITLYFAWLGHHENDRYGYLASAFLTGALVLLASLMPRPVHWGVLALWGMVATGLAVENIDRWRQGWRVYDRLVETFPHELEGDIYILGMPDSYDGFMLFRGFTPGEGLRDALRWVGGRTVKGRLHEVGAFVMRKPDDGVQVTKMAPGQWQVAFQQWGNWWVRAGLGARDFRTTDFAVTYGEGSYTVRFERIPAESHFLYSQGGKWVVLSP